MTTTVKAEEFLNLSKHRAHDLAEFKSIVFRLVSVDGVDFLGYPQDTRTDRVCCEIVNGKIVRATVQ